MRTDVPAEVIECDAKANIMKERAPAPVKRCGRGASAQKEANQAELQPSPGIESAKQNSQGVAVCSCKGPGGGETGGQADATGLFHRVPHEPGSKPVPCADHHARSPGARH